MSITTFAPALKDVAGYVKVGIGAGFASLTAPKLSEITIDLTAAIVDGVSGTTDVKMKELQLYNSNSATETLDKRTRKLDPITVYGDGSANEATFLTLVAEGTPVGVFIRPYTESATPLAAAQKGDAYNAKIACVDRGSANIGDKWSYVVTFYEVARSALNVALV